MVKKISMFVLSVFMVGLVVPPASADLLDSLKDNGVFLYALVQWWNGESDRKMQKGYYESNKQQNLAMAGSYQSASLRDLLRDFPANRRSRLLGYNDKFCDKTFGLTLQETIRAVAYIERLEIGDVEGAQFVIDGGDLGDFFTRPCPIRTAEGGFIIPASIKPMALATETPPVVVEKPSRIALLGHKRGGADGDWVEIPKTGQDPTVFDLLVVKVPELPKLATLNGDIDSEPIIPVAWPVRPEGATDADRAITKNDYQSSGEGFILCGLWIDFTIKEMKPVNDRMVLEIEVQFEGEDQAEKVTFEMAKPPIQVENGNEKNPGVAVLPPMKRGRPQTRVASSTLSPTAARALVGLGSGSTQTVESMRLVLGPNAQRALQGLASISSLRQVRVGNDVQLAMASK